MAAQTRAETLGSETERDPWEAAGLEAREAERELMGMLLEDGSMPPGAQAGYLEEATTQGLRAADLRTPMFQAVFTHMLAIVRDGLQPDLLLLYERMRGHVEDFSIADLQVRSSGSAAPNLPRLRYLVERVRDASARYRMAGAGALLTSLAGSREYAPASSADRIIATLQQLRDESLAASAGGTMLSLGDVMSAYRAQIERWRAAPFALRGTTTGLRKLDTYTRGAHPGDLWLLAARMSMGKTASCLSILLAAARACAPGRQVGIVSLEMSKAWLTHRLVAQVAGVEATAIEDGDPSLPWERIADAQDEIEQLPITMMDARDATSRVNGARGKLTPAVIRTIVQGWQQRAPLDLVAVDYLEMVRAPEGMERDRRDEQLGAIALDFKQLAEELQVPVLLLAQMNRESSKSVSKMPTLEGIHNSDQPAMHADVVLLPVRWSYYRDRGQEVPEEVASLPAGVTDILIAKQRNGRVGVARCYFDVRTQAYLDWNEERACPVNYHGTVVPIEVPMSHQFRQGRGAR